MKRTFFTLAAIAISFGVFAQSELSGSWSFKNQESISGRLYSNGSPKNIKITDSGNSFSFEKVSAGASGDVTISETVSTEKPLETLTATKRKKVVTLTKNGRLYTEVAILYNTADNTKIDHKVTDIWVVENYQLILDRKDENLTNGETWESKTYYTKQ